MKQIKTFLSAILLVFSMAVFSACSDERDEPTYTPTQTTYTIIIESSAGQIAQENGLTSRIDLTTIEYNNANEVVNIQDWSNIPDGISRKRFIANKGAKKLVIRYNVYAYKNGKEVANEIRYYAIVYYLEQNRDLIINLDGNSSISKYNPI